MAFKSKQMYCSATNSTEDFMDQVKDLFVAAGWTLHDDLSGAANYGYVLSSTGEDDDQMPLYIHMYQDTTADRVDFIHYTGWNATTHAADGYYFGNTNYSFILTDDSDPFYAWMACDMNGYVVVAKTQYYRGICAGLIDPYLDDAFGILDTAVTSGSSKDLSLGSGEAAGFEVGKTYQIVGQNSREQTTVTAVDTGTDTITVDSLTYGYEIGERIGHRPHRWFHIAMYYAYVYGVNWTTEGTGNDTANGGLLYHMVNQGSGDPDFRAGDLYAITPWMLNEVDSSMGLPLEGFPWMRCYAGTPSETILTVGDIDSGTSTGSNTTTTLNDTSKSWTTNEHAGKALVIIGGTGAPEFRTISSNTGTELTISEAWVSTPDATSDYVICEEGYLYFYINNAASSAGAMRMI